MKLPTSIEAYFAADAAQDGAALAATFAADAVVQDEGKTHRGPAAIRAWWLAAKAKYRHHAEPLDLTDPLNALNAAAQTLGLPPQSGSVSQSLAAWSTLWAEAWRA